MNQSAFFFFFIYVYTYTPPNIILVRSNKLTAVSAKASNGTSHKSILMMCTQCITDESAASVQYVFDISV